jgi:hypothetical protein
MDYKYLVSVDKAEIWERHSDTRYIGLFDTIVDANTYIKTQKDFDQHTITKIPVTPKEVTTTKNYAEFGCKMIYNLKSKEVSIGARRLYAVGEFVKPKFYNELSAKLYDTSIVVGNKNNTNDGIKIIEKNRQKLLSELLKHMNDMLFKFHEQNLITFEYGFGMKIWASIVGKPDSNIEIVNPFQSFAYMLVTQEQKAYEANPTPERLEQAFYKIMDKIT